MSLFKQWPIFFFLSAFAMTPLFAGQEKMVLALIYFLVLIVMIKGLVSQSTDREFRIPFNSFVLSICLFYIWMGLSISWSPAPSISLNMYVWLSIFPLCFFTYSLQQVGDRSYLKIGLLSITLIFALIGITQIIYSGSHHKLIVSLFTKNTYAGLLNLVVLPTTTWFLIFLSQLNKRFTILLGIALFILFFAIFQTGSRGASIALALGLIFIFAINKKYIDKFSLLKVLIILWAAFVFASFQNYNLEHNLIDRMAQSFDRQDNEYLGMHRLIVWKAAWQIIKTAPVIGLGIGTFFIAFPLVRDPLDGSSGIFVHNDYLQLWLEIGIIGLVLLLIIMVSILRIFISLLNQDNLKLNDRLEITGLVSGLIAVSIHSFVDFNFYIVAILMVMGLICARIQEIRGEYCSDTVFYYVPSNKLFHKSLMLMMGTVSVLLLIYNLSAAIAEIYWYKAKKQLANGQFYNSASSLNIGAKWNPNSLRIRFQQIQLYRSVLKTIKHEASLADRKQIMAEALTVLKIIGDINFYDGFAHENRGHLLIENSDIAPDYWQEKAVKEYRKAIHFRPRQFRARFALVKLLEQNGQLDEAVKLINDGLNYNYRHISDKYIQYAIELNLVNGDSAKAKEVQVKRGLLPNKQ